MGDRWFLGRMYYYPEGGIYFGVPLSNFVGWFRGRRGRPSASIKRGERGRRSCDQPPAGGHAPRCRTARSSSPLVYVGILVFNLGVDVLDRRALLGMVGVMIYVPIVRPFRAAHGRPATPHGRGSRQRRRRHPRLLADHRRRRGRSIAAAKRRAHELDDRIAGRTAVRAGDPCRLAAIDASTRRSIGRPPGLSCRAEQGNRTRHRSCRAASDRSVRRAALSAIAKPHGLVDLDRVRRRARRRMRRPATSSCPQLVCGSNEPCCVATTCIPMDHRRAAAAAVPAAGLGDATGPAALVADVVIASPAAKRAGPPYRCASPSRWRRAR